MVLFAWILGFSSVFAQSIVGTTAENGEDQSISCSNERWEITLNRPPRREIFQIQLNEGYGWAECTPIDPPADVKSTVIPMASCVSSEYRAQFDFGGFLDMLTVTLSFEKGNETYLVCNQPELFP